MSATEDDTELRDLLVQNLESSGLLPRIKAELRAAVFLAMEEQERLENKAPLTNENLKKCLNTEDGRLGAGLVLDFLQVLNLDFTVSVFQPETDSLAGLDSRELLCRDLGLSETEENRKSPLLLELLKRGRGRDDQGDKVSSISSEPSQTQISRACRKFDLYDKDGGGLVQREELSSVFTDLIPGISRNMLDSFITEQLSAAGRASCSVIDLQLFLGLYRRLFTQCRTVVLQDEDVVVPGREEELRSVSGNKELEAVDVVPDDSDSFFDDPLPKPQKTYGGKSEAGRGRAEGGRGRAAGSSVSEQSLSRNDDDVEYDDDFNSHRSDLSRSEVSIGEEIQEVSIEGPEPSEQVEDSTQDLSVSQLSHSVGADYMEDVS